MQTDPTTTPDGEAGPPPPPDHHPAKRHRVLVPLLATLGILCIFVSTVSVWIRDSVLDSNTWANQSGQLLQSPNVRNLVAAYVADQAITRTDTEAALSKALPPRLRPLAAPGTAALGRLAVEGVDRALTLPRIQQLWMTANRRANERMVAFLKGDTPRLQASNGQVVLNLDRIVAETATSLGASGAAVDQIRSRVRPVVLVRSSQLGAAQTGVQAIEVLSVWPLLIGVVLAGVAVYLARDRRRTTVRGLAVGLLVMGVGLLVIRKLAGDIVVDDLVTVDSVKPAAHDAWNIYTTLLAESAAAGIALGTLGLAWSWVSSPSSAAAGLRRRLAPTFRLHPLVPHVALALAVLVVLLVGPVGTPRRTIGVVIAIGLAFLGMEVWRRQTVREFPTAEAGVGTAVREALAGLRREPARPAGGDRVAALERLAALHERGALSDAEYEQEKALVRSP